MCTDKGEQVETGSKSFLSFSASIMSFKRLWDLKAQFCSFFRLYYPFRMTVLLLLLSLEVMLAAVGASTCTNGADCMEGYSCIESFCKKCLKCSLLLRKGDGCVLDFNDCKDCLEGYEEILVTGFSTIIKPCRPIKRKITLLECIDDIDCPPNKYCAEASCVKCFDCVLVNRLPPDGNCAKKLLECGPRMNRLHEGDCETDTNPELCLQKKEYFSNYKITTSDLVAVLIFLTLLLLFALCGFLKWSNRRKSGILNKSISHELIVPSAPPLNTVDAQKFVEEYNPTFDVHFEHESRQRAKIFKQPNAPYYSGWEEGNYDEPPESNGFSEHNSDSISGSNAAIRSQLVSQDLAAVVLPRSSIRPSVGDSTAVFPAEEPGNFSAEANGSSDTASEAVEVAAGTQADVAPVNEVADTVITVVTSELGQT